MQTQEPTSKKQAQKAQSAMEYLMTYGWAILIIAVVLAALYMLGIFNSSTFVKTFCEFTSSSLGCTNPELLANGSLNFEITNYGQFPIAVNAINCNSNAADFSNSIAPGVQLGIGDNYSASLKCYENSTVFTGVIGQAFQGYINVNYTDTLSGFSHVDQARAVLKVK
ncbi:MAG: hypothetical protein M1331_01990 [Candidatus Marsarchaeota archaeon]|nr:hypothetical protein [Candidatus Marsarchaeota archaeon]MCL5106147.1 hypothetical protein [Candidatus Marsarchaeota archaeon]